VEIRGWGDFRMACKRASLSFLCVVSIVSVFAFMFVVSIPSASAENLQCPSNCGNGKIDIGEQCDDHNTVNGDGCSSDCKIENCTMLLTKTDSPDPVATGGVLKYTLKLKNIGTTDCTGGGVQLKEYYDRLTAFVSATPAPTSGNNL